MLWPKDASQGHIVVSGNGKGKQPNQLDCLTGLWFDRQGNLYVIDRRNIRAQKFDINSDWNYFDKMNYDE
jgi:hypothetical protein